MYGGSQLNRVERRSSTDLSWLTRLLLSLRRISFVIMPDNYTALTNVNRKKDANINVFS